MNFASIGEQVIAGVIVLFLSTLISITTNYFLNREWTKKNIISLIKSDKNLQEYLENISSGLKNKKILILQEHEDNNLIDTLKEIPLFKDLKITKGSHHNIERISANDLTIVSTRVLTASEDQRDSVFTEIISRKTDDKALVFFSPHGESTLELTKEELKKINARSLTSVTRQSGRLANDVLSLLTLLS